MFGDEKSSQEVMEGEGTAAAMPAGMEEADKEVALVTKDNEDQEGGAAGENVSSPAGPQTLGAEDSYAFIGQVEVVDGGVTSSPPLDPEQGALPLVIISVDGGE